MSELIRRETRADAAKVEVYYVRCGDCRHANWFYTKVTSCEKCRSTNVSIEDTGHVDGGYSE